MTTDIQDLESTQRDYVCGVCQAELTISTNPPASGVVLRCTQDRSHSGYSVRETITDIVATEGGPIYLENQLDRRSPVRQGDMNLAVHEGVHRFNLTTAQATTFIAQAKRLGLDPFLGQIAPLKFTSKKSGKEMVIPFPNEKGWAALAKRAEPDEFIPPRVERMDEDEIEQWGYPRDSFGWKAIGTKKSWGGFTTEEIGMLTPDQYANAVKNGVPAGNDPHNFARRTAMRHWYEQNYPDVIMITSQLEMDMPDEARQIIEMEFSIERADEITSDIHPWLVRCPIHGIDWKENSKDGSKWYSHRDGDKWCNQSKALPGLVKARVEKIGPQRGLAKSDVRILWDGLKALDLPKMLEAFDQWEKGDSVEGEFTEADVDDSGEQGTSSETRDWATSVPIDYAEVFTWAKAVHGFDEQTIFDIFAVSRQQDIPDVVPAMRKIEAAAKK